LGWVTYGSYRLLLVGLGNLRTTSQQTSWAFMAEKKTSTFTTEQNIACVNFLRKPSKSLILMAINALIAIRLIHLLPLAKF
jgi:hypothetical protein